MILAAINLKRLRAYRLAVVAGILAIVLSPINFLIGIPMGMGVGGVKPTGRAGGV